MNQIVLLVIQLKVPTVKNKNVLLYGLIQYRYCPVIGTYFIRAGLR